MTTRGKYNSLFNYRLGKEQGYAQAKREMYNAVPEIIHKHSSAIEREILDWRLSWVK